MALWGKRNKGGCRRRRGNVRDGGTERRTRERQLLFHSYNVDFQSSTCLAAAPYETLALKMHFLKFSKHLYVTYICQEKYHYPLILLSTIWICEPQEVVEFILLFVVIYFLFYLKYLLCFCTFLAFYLRNYLIIKIVG